MKSIRETKTDVDLKKARSTIIIDAKSRSLTEWEEDWRSSTKGSITKEFFPTIKYRLENKLSHSKELTTILTGHGRINSYYHRFKIKDNPKCICSETEQTVEHILYECSELAEQRYILIQSVSRNGGKWPLPMNELAHKHLESLAIFANAIDFEKLSI